jgi:hypothetical protein
LSRKKEAARGLKATDMKRFSCLLIFLITLAAFSSVQADQSMRGRRKTVGDGLHARCFPRRLDHRFWRLSMKAHTSSPDEASALIAKFFKEQAAAVK